MKYQVLTRALDPQDFEIPPVKLVYARIKIDLRRGRTHSNSPKVNQNTVAPKERIKIRARAVKKGDDRRKGKVVWERNEGTVNGVMKIPQGRVKWDSLQYMRDALVQDDESKNPRAKESEGGKRGPVSTAGRRTQAWAWLYMHHEMQQPGTEIGPRNTTACETEIWSRMFSREMELGIWRRNAQFRNREEHEGSCGCELAGGRRGNMEHGSRSMYWSLNFIRPPRWSSSLLLGSSSANVIHSLLRRRYRRMPLANGTWIRLRPVSASIYPQAKTAGGSRYLALAVDKDGGRESRDPIYLIHAVVRGDASSRDDASKAGTGASCAELARGLCARRCGPDACIRGALSYRMPATIDGGDASRAAMRGALAEGQYTCGGWRVWDSGCDRGLVGGGRGVMRRVQQRGARKHTSSHSSVFDERLALCQLPDPVSRRVYARASVGGERGGIRTLRATSRPRVDTRAWRRTASYGAYCGEDRPQREAKITLLVLTRN
ncbi:hypothetical protein C8R44DRAFT_753957 [Mycena epipterygia]|nr:hypothetical protein C8R44DRAFT_753957 [Mycena epipterygia]